MEAEPQERTIHLAEYYHILYKHKTLIILSVVLTVMITALYTFRMKPIYQATATIIIDREKHASPLTGEERDYESYVTQELNFNTHLTLITSGQVLAKTVEDLALDRVDSEQGLDEGFFRELVKTVKSNLKRLLGRESRIVTPEEKMIRLMNALRGKIGIEGVRDTRLLKVDVEDPDPELARRIANTLAENYIEFNLKGRMDSSRNNMGWMTDQLYEVKKKLEDAERDFLEYKETERVFSIEGRQGQISQKMADFNNNYLTVRNRRMELDAKLAAVRQSVGGAENIFSARSIIDNPVIENLYQQLLDADMEATHLAKVFKPKHPKMIQVRTRIENTRKKLQEELSKEVENLRVERDMLATREHLIQKTLKDFENDALDTNRKELQYTMLHRNVETNQNLYNVLLTRIKESDIVNELAVSNIRLAEPAGLPLAPVKPKKQRNLLLGIIFGLMTGVGLAFLLEYMDQSLRTEEDVQEFLGLPVMAIVPQVDGPGTP